MKIIRADGVQFYTLDDARAILLTAIRAFGASDAAYREAALTWESSMNNLNEAQRAFDAACQDFRVNAPVGSVWGSVAAEVKNV